ncbi:MAG: PIN domain-containing protein [Leptospiraceae bacterium]|nr:PIN domain-containing protein [Leptospiraceae bacterium]MCK6381795.1 PIN domain-containing protein [Leptospiraceae bacterium]NUM41703.1 PIN domain-containing protein [Leptospiraceae bacterium]
MNCYLDSSVALDWILHLKSVEPIGLKKIETIVSSELLEIECSRVLDRYRLQALLDDVKVSESKKKLKSLLESIGLIEITEKIKKRAKDSFPTIIGTLDAIHLSSALLWAEELRKPFVLLTRDKQMKVCSEALGIEVLGL